MYSGHFEITHETFWTNNDAMLGVKTCRAARTCFAGRAHWRSPLCLSSVRTRASSAVRHAGVCPLRLHAWRWCTWRASFDPQHHGGALLWRHMHMVYSSLQLLTLPNKFKFDIDNDIFRNFWIFFGSTYRKGEILMQMWHVNSQCVLLLHEIHIGVGVGLAMPGARQWIVRRLQTGLSALYLTFFFLAH